MKLVSALLCTAAYASAAHALTPAQCAALTALSIPATTITDAAVVPATASLPEYCRVKGNVDVTINFELRLPASWNGKFYHQGGGGFVGSIPGTGPGARGRAFSSLEIC
jgi:feruloyl esterase